MSILTTQISRSEAAQLIGKTPRWINKLEVAGFIKKTERGKYLAADVAQGYAQSLIVDRRSTTQSVAQTQLTEARTVLLKQRNERKVRQVAGAGGQRDIQTITPRLRPQPRRCSGRFHSRSKRTTQT